MQLASLEIKKITTIKSSMNFSMRWLSSREKNIKVGGNLAVDPVEASAAVLQCSITSKQHLMFTIKHELHGPTVITIQVCKGICTFRYRNIWFILNFLHKNGTDVQVAHSAHQSPHEMMVV